MHKIVLQNNLVELGTGIPVIDNVSYCQVVDEENKDADDDKRISEELKNLAASYQNLSIEKEAPDLIGDFLVQLGSTNK